MNDKELILTAIEFLGGIPEDHWCTEQQTKDWSVENIGRCHCAFGHLAVNPASPFFGSLPLSHSKTTSSLGARDDGFKEAEPRRIHIMVIEKTASNLADINNYAIKPYDQPSPKQRVMAALNDTLSKL